MATISVEEAERRLSEIIELLPPDGEVVLTRNQQPVALLRVLPQSVQSGRRFGTLKGSVLSISPDFDDIPAGFEDYLP
jgi:antitoxin (DNA-binding transcriptional repressor) of toxin-antitoxin stability system